MDSDRFEGKPRDGAHAIDVSDLMRRMVKENLRRFDGRPLFPERIATTVPYKLSDAEAHLYKAVTEYVREEFNRAEALQNEKQAGTVGFALTVLQRRLASSPEAILQSLTRRRKRLEERQRELELLKRGITPPTVYSGITLDAEDLEDLEDAPDAEVEQSRRGRPRPGHGRPQPRRAQAGARHASGASRASPTRRHSGDDTKWRQLAACFTRCSSSGPRTTPTTASCAPATLAPPRQRAKNSSSSPSTGTPSPTSSTGSPPHSGEPDAVVTIHGGMGREQRLHTQEAFRHDPTVQVLVATDAAGEGINLQRAHLMVNYDLPWNPNRLEQRFGRIHRIGQPKSATCGTSWPKRPAKATSTSACSRSSRQARRRSAARSST